MFSVYRLVTWFVRVISKQAIWRFSEKYDDARTPLLHWYSVTKQADWKIPADIRIDFNHADFVGPYTVFNIAETGTG